MDNEMKMASAPDIQDERNELAMKLFGKPLRLLTPEEMDLLDEEAERLLTVGQLREYIEEYS